VDLRGCAERVVAMNDELSDDEFNSLSVDDIDGMLADESRDALWSAPVFCVVNGHNFDHRTHFCRNCGTTDDPMMLQAMARLERRAL
jgi:hypothetical protein